MKYKAFICYKHSEFSRPHAIALETALKRYAKPLFKAPIKIFRDEKHMAPNLDLPALITDALNNTENLIFLAEKESAESLWCQQELEYWCSQLEKKEDLIIIYLNDQLVYDARRQEILWEQTDALPDLLRKYISSIPLYVDLTWAKTPESRDLLNPRYKDAVNGVMAKIRDVHPADLSDEEIWIYKRNRRLRTWAIVLLSILLLTSLFATGWAVNRSNFAKKQEQIAKDSAYVALQQRQIAEDSAYVAQQQRLIAQLQKDTAELERQRAEIAQLEAEQQRDRAKVERQNAIVARNEAEIQRDSANLERRRAYVAQIEAEHQRDTANQERIKAVEARDIAHANLLEARALLNLYKNDPTKAMKIAEYLYLKTPVNISIPMINCFYDDFILYQGKTYASPFYEIIRPERGSKIKVALLLKERWLVENKENDNDIFLTDLEKRSSKKLISQQQTINALHASDDGNYFLSVSDDNKAILWSKDGKMITTISDPSARGFTGAFLMPYSEDGKHEIITGEKGGEIKRWSSEGHELFKDPLNTGNISKMTVSPNGHIIATSTRDKKVIIRTWDRRGASYKWDDTVELNTTLRSIQFFSNNEYLLVATDKAVFTYHVKTKVKKNILDIKWRQLVHTVKLSSGEKYALVTFSDGTAGVYDLMTQQSMVVLKGSNYPITTVSFDEKSGIAHGLSLNGTLRKWNIKGKLIDVKRSPKKEFDTQLYEASFSKNKRWELISQESKIIIKDHDDAANNVELIGHLAEVTSANFAPTGDLIITCSEDKTARIWSLNGSNLHTFYFGTPLKKAFFTKDSKYIVLQPAPGTYYLYPISPTALLDISGRLHIPDLHTKEKKDLNLE